MLDLKEVLAQHKLWLNSLGKSWSRADLSGVNLSYANLNLAILSGANLAHANLSGANRPSAKLAVAKLPGANLTGVRLAEANVVEACLANIQRDFVTNLDVAGKYQMDRRNPPYQN